MNFARQRERYPAEIKQAEAQRQKMQEHFNKMKRGSGDVDAKVDGTNFHNDFMVRCTLQGRSLSYFA
jgi:hypothetical protein